MEETQEKEPLAPNEEELIAMALVEEKERFPFRKEDLRYKHIEVKTKNESNAVVICIMDVSGSMGENEKYIARAFFFLLYQFVKRRYSGQVEVVFVRFHTAAKEVDEDTFFHSGESGGTNISSGIKEAIRIISARYHPSLWNIYTVTVSDGDNSPNDDEEAVKMSVELARMATLFGYVEVATNETAAAIYQTMFNWGNPYGGVNANETFYDKVTKALKATDKDNYAVGKISDKKGVWPVLKHLLEKDKD